MLLGSRSGSTLKDGVEDRKQVGEGLARARLCTGCMPSVKFNRKDTCEIYPERPFLVVRAGWPSVV